MLSVLWLSVGLAMDATAVAAARGFSARKVTAAQVLKVALLFGGFQALMPLLGWLLGGWLGRAAEAWDHWIAFALLSGIGAKMVWEARGGDDGDEDAAGEGVFGLRVLLGLAVATSLDAAAAGIALPMMNAPFFASLLTIGAVTAVLSALGVLLGRRFGALLGKRLEVFGGLVLIALGARMLVFASFD